jgi:Secretion system C-terminal sorting domain
VLMLMESNTAYFEIQHSVDGINFTSLGNVNAAGFSSRQQQYKFDDVKVGAGQNYYRLKMFDKDGRYELSNIVSIKVAIKGLIVTKIYPSPFTDNVSISIASENKAQASIRLLDNTGKVLANQTSAVNKGVTIINVNNLAKLAKGFYIVEVKAGEAVYTQKIIK